MRSAKKRLTKRKRKTKPVMVQIGIRVHVPKGKRVAPRVTAELLREVTDKWLETGELPNGIEIVPVVYTHQGHSGVEVRDLDKIEEVRASMLSFFRIGGFGFEKFRIRQIR